MDQAVTQAAPAGVTQQSAPPAPPAPPPSPSAPYVTSTGVVLNPPTTAAEIRALRDQRSELSNQLVSAAGRREELARDMARAPDAAQPGLQARIDLLDERILKLEADIAESGRLLVSATGSVVDDAPSIPGIPRMDFTAVSVVFTLFVLAPIAFTIARSIWRRGSAPPADATLERANAERLGRLETAVDSIAVEVERISEGQRFVTKLLAESKDKLRVEAPRS
ncbi:MAG: hypothetical protein KJZ74_10090 [Gemmatimonadales bacterium]|nr:hypothetical protein [Gemmatimonadota bacterium]MCL4214257.1 hypothetical protein [Gemmatimonadales bacterium]